MSIATKFITSEDKVSQGIKYFGTLEVSAMFKPIADNISKSMTDYSNIGQSIFDKTDRHLHITRNNPIYICKNMIYDYFTKHMENYATFHIEDSVNPIASVEDNFDNLLITHAHVSRGRSDTYYISENKVLRTHMSASQPGHLKAGLDNFLVTGCVYRKDEVDRSHYPIFHQLEGLAVVPEGVDPISELKKVLSGLVEYLFPGCEYRFNKDSFPFTDPSIEIEVKLKNTDVWLEILGAGITKKEIITNAGRSGTWWAFGLGLERLCMIMFDIPDIRYFWSTDERFTNQFDNSLDPRKIKFVPFSANLETEIKDISFWINPDQLDEKNNWSMENDFMTIVREVCGDAVEHVGIHDAFTNKKNGKHSKCYRLKILPIDTTITDPGLFKEKCKDMMKSIRELMEKNVDLHVEIR